MANLVTIVRVALIFAIIAVWARQLRADLFWLDLLMVPLLGWAIFMDAVDGWVARKFNEASELGALFDIAGDRIVELVLWIFFAIRADQFGVPFVPYWVPLVMVARTVFTDFIRSAAFKDGHTPFGARTLQTARWARALTSSRWSRASYGILKAVAFCFLGAAFVWDHLPATAGYGTLRWITALLVYATVGLGVLRGLPVLWEGRRYLEAQPTPTADPVPATSSSHPPA